MNRAQASVSLAFVLATSCSTTGSTPSPTPAAPHRYSLGADATPPLAFERHVVAKDGTSWTFLGYIPDESCATSMAEKVARFADGWSCDAYTAVHQYCDVRGSQEYRDLLVASAERRYAHIWSTEWMALHAEEITVINVPDLDGDGCIDLVIDQKPGKYELRTGTGRIVER